MTSFISLHTSHCIHIILPRAFTHFLVLGSAPDSTCIPKARDKSWPSTHLSGNQRNCRSYYMALSHKKELAVLANASQWTMVLACSRSSGFVFDNQSRRSLNMHVEFQSKLALALILHPICMKHPTWRSLHSMAGLFFVDEIDNPE